MSFQQPLLIATLLLPLVGFVVSFPIGKEKFSDSRIGISIFAILLPFLSSCLLMFILTQEDLQRISVHLFDWLSLPSFNIGFSLNFDRLSGLLALVITGVGLLVHIFSYEYMAKDPRRIRYYSYLNLFIFMMLILIFADNLLLMFLGWEGVGLCSYLLIGFWHQDKAKSAAGLKAFITNRVGDAGLLLGIFSVAALFGTLDFSSLAEQARGLSAEVGWGPLGFTVLFLFVGAIGKSAQFPLLTWLPSAMAGPTPVSALIHAATMVTAGVYLLVRLSDLVMLSPVAMSMVTWVGVLTALIGATVAIVQNDIKRILAFSTVSQLGFMFISIGVGAFAGAVFHLLTHAMFKALLFLGAGSVIHNLEGEKDIRKMGGLRKNMVITHATFLCGWWSIIGIPPFSGFFSKDEILWKAYINGSVIIWCGAFIAAILTAFYMTRLMALVFWGPSKTEVVESAKESRWMTGPLIVLAGLSLFVGFLGWPGVFNHLLGGIFGELPNIINQLLGKYQTVHIHRLKSGGNHHVFEISLMILTILFSVLAAFIATAIYVKKVKFSMTFSSLDSLARMAQTLKLLQLRASTLLEKEYYLDEVYERHIVQRLLKMSRNQWYYVEKQWIDQMSEKIVALTKALSQNLRAMQNGKIHHYLQWMLIGILMLLFVVSGGVAG